MTLNEILVPNPNAPAGLADADAAAADDAAAPSAPSYPLFGTAFAELGATGNIISLDLGNTIPDTGPTGTGPRLSVSGATSSRATRSRATSRPATGDSSPTASHPGNSRLTASRSLTASRNHFHADISFALRGKACSQAIKRTANLIKISYPVRIHVGNN